LPVNDQASSISATMTTTGGDHDRRLRVRHAPIKLGGRVA
jgi:hypothetical protein